MVPAYHRAERLLTVEHLTLRYGAKTILNDVNLMVDNIVRPEMSQGQVIALLGPSGIGKTQLFRCLAGLQNPTEGKINLMGKPVNAGDVGVVFQNYPLLKHRTVWSNLKLASSKLRGKDVEITNLLKQFGIEDKKDLYPAQLSGGQRQRVAIIQQLLCSSHFILMDEPFSGLDILMKEKVSDLIEQVAQVDERNTMIITTHDIDMAVAIADTVWVLGMRPDGLGATIINQVDLIERGLAWNANVRTHPNFVPTVRELENLFHH